MTKLKRPRLPGTLILLGSVLVSQAAFSAPTVATGVPPLSEPSVLPSGSSSVLPSGPSSASPSTSLPVSNTPIRMALSPKVALVSNLLPPADIELINEAGLRGGAETEESLDLMAGWIKGGLEGSERNRIQEKCAELDGEDPQKIWKFPVCIPRFLGILAREQNAGASKPTPVAPLVGVRKKENFPSLKGADFQRAYLALDPRNPKELAQYAEYLNPYSGNCEFRGAFAALIARSESFFPSSEARQVLEQFYQPAFVCLSESDPGYERTHLRVGLVRLLEGKEDLARQSLLMASQAEKPEEEFRTLFWLGVLADEGKAKEPSEGNTESIYWKLLRHRYPITIHSILAAHSVGVDPFGRFEKHEPVFMRRRSPAPDQLQANLVSFVFETLISRREFLAADKWSDFVASKLNAPEHEDQLLYLAWCHSQVQKHRAAISMLSRYMRKASQDGYNVALLDMLFPRAFSDEILKETDKVDPVLVFALVRQESAFDPMARSVADARGLMQLLPSTAKRWLGKPHKELYIPSQNVMAGVNYLENLLQRYGGTVEHVLAAYNAGPGNVDKWKKRLPEANTLLFSDLIPFRETRTYVAIILRNAYWYGRLLVQLDDDIAKRVVDLSGKAAWKSQMVHNLLSVAWGTLKDDQKVAELSGLYNARKPQSVLVGPP